MKTVVSMLFLCVLFTESAMAETPAEKISRASTMLNGAQRQQGITLLNEAIAECKQAIESNPGNAQDHFDLGRAFFYLEKDADAIAAFDKAIALKADFAEAHFMRGVVLRYMHKDDEAIGALKEAARLDPKKAKYVFELGEVYYIRKDDATAIPYYEQTLALEPKHVKAMMHLADILAGQQKEEQAIELWKKAIEIDSNQLNAHYNLGQAYQNRKMYQDALKQFNQVVTIEPNDWRARAKLVQLHQALGDMAKRDSERASLFELRKSGRVKELSKAESYCRDQFAVGDKDIMAYELFELKGDKAQRYVFWVYDASQKKRLFNISLGSYEATNQYAKEAGQLKDGERLFHLDGYFPNGGHSSYGMFKAEPPYDKVREMVVDVVTNKIKPVSESKPE